MQLGPSRVEHWLSRLQAIAVIIPSVVGYDDEAHFSLIDPVVIVASAYALTLLDADVNENISDLRHLLLALLSGNP